MNDASSLALTPTSNGGLFYQPKSQFPIELPLLQTSQNSSALQTPSNFYSGYGYNDSGTPSTVSSTTYPSFFPNYNPYPHLELNMIFNPFGFGMDIGSEVVSSFAGVDSQSTLFPQTLSPLQSTHSAAVAAAAMTRYSNRASAAANRKGGRRPREDYFQEDLTDNNDEDKDKRDKRRQRNKEAAARCRQRRLDLMQTLQHQRDTLEARNNQLQQHYGAVKKALEDMVRSLQNHICPSREQLNQHLEMASQTLRDHTHGQLSQMAVMSLQMPQSSSIVPQAPQQLPVQTTVNNRKRSHGGNENKRIPTSSVETQQSQPLARPQTLHLPYFKDDSLVSPVCTDDFLFKRSKFAEDSPADRPSTLALNWDQSPALNTPGCGIPQIADLQVRRGFACRPTVNPGVKLGPVTRSEHAWLRNPADCRPGQEHAPRRLVQHAQPTDISDADGAVCQFGADIGSSAQ
uniref:BZIP domain-containing protein n=1 Tax=Panagrolaimus sp. JU765 TaxID=591449 RepID=A0AC34QRB9_9BILA